MNYLLDAKQMKEIDTYSIQTVGIPSVVLMERAALAVSSVIISKVSKTALKDMRVLCVCGYGNNGADGLAVARQLAEKGVSVTVMLVQSDSNQAGKTGTEEFELQKSILINIGVEFRNNVNFSEYNFIIDGIFGIGLSRDITGNYAAVINQINASKQNNPAQMIIAIDVPSGVNASNGQIMSVAVRADETITFGYHKIGLVRYPGASYAGKVTVSQIGFATQAIDRIQNKAITFTDDDLTLIPKRCADTNKGSFGKVLIIAGSEDMGGAACLSSLAAYRSGCGLVKVFTHQNNRNLVLGMVPEAIMCTYDSCDDAVEKLEDALDWASCVIIGPGIGTSKRSYDIVKHVIQYFIQFRKQDEKWEVPLIMDADAINLVSAHTDLSELLDRKTEIKLILTPHMGEMSRLTGVKIQDLKMDSGRYAMELSKKFHAVCVLKDAVTAVSDGNNLYYNMAGNCGMATAGSGDVLTGVIAGMLSSGLDAYHAACMGVYVHARAGDAAAEKLGTFSMKAKDIAEEIATVLQQI